MVCQECGVNAPENARFCPECGTRLPVVSDDGDSKTFEGPQASSATGTTFQRGVCLMHSRYEIVCELGRGGMGVVYQAIDHTRGADIALKTLPPQLRRDERALLNLKHEVNTALELTHENICRVYDFQECSEAQFITMELIEGASLDKLLFKRQQEGKDGFPLEWVLKCLKPICSALDYAHGKGIVHRDLKPGNVLVHRDRVVKLTDFGLARVVRTSMSKYSREATSGTLLYMSPEQCLGKPTDARSDIYSLGMLTYELLTGKAPFADAADITYCQLHEDLEPIPSLPASANACLARATSKDKKGRPSSCASFFDGLSALSIKGTWHISKAPNFSKHEPLPGEVRTFADIDFVWIPQGTFMMGSTPQEHNFAPNERQHQVTISQGFWLAKYQVTQAQWCAVMGNSPSRFAGADRPVENVSWNDCYEYIRRLNARQEERFRFPTEAEWEYACRAGTTTAYSFGDAISDLEHYAWYKKNSRATTHRVGQKRPNVWGLHDMHGNVWEWCQDWYAEYPASFSMDPKGPPDGSSRVVRGGSWGGEDLSCRSARRKRRQSDEQLSSCGLRLCRDR